MSHQARVGKALVLAAALAAVGGQAVAQEGFWLGISGSGLEAGSPVDRACKREIALQHGVEAVWLVQTGWQPLAQGGTALLYKLGAQRYACGFATLSGVFGVARLR